MAGLGFFAKELNVGWKEWTEDRLPTHKGRADGARCTCSDVVDAPEHLGSFR